MTSLLSSSFLSATSLFWSGERRDQARVVIKTKGNLTQQVKIWTNHFQNETKTKTKTKLRLEKDLQQMREKRRERERERNETQWRRQEKK